MILKVRLMGACAVCGILLGMPLAEAGCNLPNNGGQATVSITAPTANAKITMSSIGYPLLTLTAEEPDPDGVANSLEWTLTDYTFANNTGTSVPVTLTAWPSDNSKFGKKTLSLTYDGLSSDGCSDTRDINIYFRKSSDTDIGGTPAWYKYWKLGALPQLHDFTVVSHLEDEDGNVALGLYQAPKNLSLQSGNKFDCFPSGESFFISEELLWYSSLPLTRANSTVSGTSLIIASAVVEHEYDHQDRTQEVCGYVQSMWDTYWEDLSWLEKWVTGDHETEIAFFWSIVDEDQDMVLNFIDEHNIPGGTWDDEYWAEMAMSGTSGDKEKDWSQNGEQW
ncbi:hypothetical protein P4C99_21220 [Pontiellaceae bacterium B1224]|nr:hypothetical protein [Pontiellaceae bacterium B1224]